MGRVDRRKRDDVIGRRHRGRHGAVFRRDVSSDSVNPGDQQRHLQLPALDRLRMRRVCMWGRMFALGSVVEGQKGI